MGTSFKDQFDVLRAGGVPPDEAAEAAHLVSDEAVQAHLGKQLAAAKAEAAAAHEASPEGQEAAAAEAMAKQEALEERAVRARYALVAEGAMSEEMAAQLSPTDAISVAGWNPPLTVAEKAREAGVSEATYIRFSGEVN